MHTNTHTHTHTYTLTCIHAYKRIQCNTHPVIISLSQPSLLSTLPLSHQPSLYLPSLSLPPQPSLIPTLPLSHHPLLSHTNPPSTFPPYRYHHNPLSYQPSPSHITPCSLILTLPLPSLSLPPQPPLTPTLPLPSLLIATTTTLSHALLLPPQPSPSTFPPYCYHNNPLSCPIATTTPSQEPHLDLLSSLLNEPGGTHVRRICKSIRDKSIRR